jgi:hypothetical protein
VNGNLLRVTFTLFCVFAGSSFANCQSSGAISSDTERHPDSKERYRWDQLSEDAGFPRSYNFPVFVVGDKMFAMLGYGVWASADGRMWTRTALEPLRRNVYTGQYVQFRDAIYLLGDHDGNYESITFVPKVRKTTDMVSWQTLGTSTNLPGRIFPGTVVFRDKIWLIGGYDTRRFFNDVWSSSDGAQWLREVENAGFTPRSGMGLVVYKDRLWLLGGGVIDGMPNNNPDSQNEIWSTADGKQWTKHDSRLPLMAGGTAVVFDDELWLVGANRDGVFGRSSVVTSDLINWREVAAPWSPRGGVAAWVFDNRLFVTGGKYSYTENGNIHFVYSNDVWAMARTGK